MKSLKPLLVVLTVGACISASAASGIICSNSDQTLVIMTDETPEAVANNSVDEVSVYAPSMFSQKMYFSKENSKMGVFTGGGPASDVESVYILTNAKENFTLSLEVMKERSKRSSVASLTRNGKGFKEEVYCQVD